MLEKTPVFSDFLVKLDDHGEIADFVPSDPRGDRCDPLLMEFVQSKGIEWVSALHHCMANGKATVQWSAHGGRCEVSLVMDFEEGVVADSIVGAFRFHHGPLGEAMGGSAARSTQRPYETPAALKELLEASGGVFFVIEWASMRVVDAGKATIAAFGYRPEEFHLTSPEQLFPLLSREKLREELRRAVGAGETTATLHTVIMRKDGSAFDAEVTLKSLSELGDGYVGVVARDVTLQSNAYKELEKAKRKLRIMGSINRSVLKSGTEYELVQSVLDRVVSQSGYLGVYSVVRCPETSPLAVVYNGDNGRGNLLDYISDFADSASIERCLFETPFAERAVFRNEPRLATGRNGLPKWIMPSIGSCAVLPLVREQRSFGALVFFAKEVGAFDDEELDLLEELAAEVAFGIISLRREQARIRAEARNANRLRVESAISQFSNSLLKGTEFVTGVKKALPSLAKASGADHVFLYENVGQETDGGGYRMVCDWVKPGIRSGADIAFTLSITESSQQWIDELAESMRMDRRGFELPKDLRLQLKLEDHHRLLAYPLFIHGKIFGFMGFCLTKSKRVWDETTHQMLSVGAHLVEELRSRVESDRDMRLLATAINNSNEGVIVSSRVEGYRRSRITFVNEGLLRLVECEESDLLGKSPECLFECDIEHGDEVVSKACRQRVRLQRPSGEEIIAELKVYPIVGTGDQAVHYITVLVDITEKEQMESKLAFANKMESIGQLSAGIAHEINTPSQFVGDNLHFIRSAWEKIGPALTFLIESDGYERFAAADENRGCLPAKKLARILENVPEAIQDAVEGSERITSIVRAMKEFSHPERKMTLGDINSCIRTTVTVTRNEWKYVSELEADLEQNLPLLRFMPGDINQVLLNLIVNAAQAIEEANAESGALGRIRIESRLVGESVRVSISDTGCGIPSAHRENVFNPFFTTKQVGKGTGQGLFMAHSVVEQGHGGRIWYESEMGKGTTFHIELPVVENCNGSN